MTPYFFFGNELGIDKTLFIRNLSKKLRRDLPRTKHLKSTTSAFIKPLSMLREVASEKGSKKLVVILGVFTRQLTFERY